MPDAVKTALETNAQGPAQVEQDGTRVSQHSLKDQIEADRYLDGKAAASRKSTGLRFFKLVPPGSA